MTHRIALHVMTAGLFAIGALPGEGFAQDWDYDPTWEAPSDYYSTLGGLTGSALADRLHIITEKNYNSSGLDFSSVSNINAHAQHNVTAYGDRGPALDELDKAYPRTNPVGLPWDLNLMYTDENRSIVSSVSKNTEHVWSASRHNPGSRDDAGADYSDLYNLRWIDTSVNSFKSNANFGGFNGPTGTTGYGYNTVSTPVGNFSLFDPGDAHRGDTARISFYMDVRYDGTESQTGDLELVEGNPSFVPAAEQGSLTELVKYHFADPVNGWELRRNHLLFADTYVDEFGNNQSPFWTQGNRNWAVDRPELVWSVFMGQDNDTQINVGGAPDSNGGSSVDIVLDRVMVGGTVGALGTQSVNINKTGNDGTYYSIATSGGATAEDGGEDATGRFNAFEMNTAGSRSIDVGFNGSINTATAGFKGGTVTIDNLDITTAGNAGEGGNDNDDTINVGVNVVDDRTITASSVDVGTYITGGFALGTTTFSTAGDDETNTRVTINAGSFNNGTSAVNTGTNLFDTDGETDTAAVSVFNANVGHNFETVTLSVGNGALTGEGLAGESVNNIDVMIESTVLDHANGSFSSGSDVNTLTIDFGVQIPNSGTVMQAANLYNLEEAVGFTAALDLDSISGGSAALSTDLSTFSNLAAGGMQGFNGLFDTSQPAGLYLSTVDLTLSDEDLVGAATGVNMSIDLEGIVTVAGDGNLDAVVDQDDIDLLIGNLGQAGTWTDSDFSGNGIVDIFDISLLAAAFGTDLTPGGPSSITAVPEPASLALLGLMGAALLRRRSR